MIKALFIIILSLLAASFLWHKFILPFYLKKFDWYGKYEETLKMVQSISSYDDLLVAQKNAMDFINMKVKDGDSEYIVCRSAVTRLLSKKASYYTPRAAY